jgi:PTH1 family peptidyl-tRNA hydrolase
LYGIGEINNEKVILLKPQTYMNLSGEAIIKFKNFYKITQNQIIIIYDDIDLDVGMIRIKEKGSGGTHNGMKSVIQHLGTEDFARIRIGIGKPEYKEDLTNYVIGRISNEERELLDNSVNKALEAVLEILEHGIESAMNKFN